MNIPRELRERPQWLVWRIEERRGKPTKVPYRCAEPRLRAKSDNPATWATFTQATAVLERLPGRFAGRGFVFSPDDPLTGVDLDDCIDPETGEMHPAAAAIVAELGGYIEISPSGTGVHCIVEAKLHSDRHSTEKTEWGGKFEVYDEKRYFTVTGNGGGEITERQAQIDSLVVQMFAPAMTNGRGPGRTAEELVKQFSKLGRIARHQGKPPKTDDSDSGWDFWLTCEGCRCGLTDAELTTMLEYARRGDPKGDRSDYIRNTITAARRATAGERRKTPAGGVDFVWISERYNIAADPIVGGKMIGDVDSGKAIVHLTRASGRRLRLPCLDDLFDPRKHTRVVSRVARSRFMPLDGAEAHNIAQAFIALCPGRDVDPTELTRQWITDCVEDLQEITTAVMYGDECARWDSLVEREDRQAKFFSMGRTVAMRDERGELWLPAKRFKEHIGERIDWGDLRTLLEEIGWRREHPDEWERGVKRDAGARHIHTVFYVGREPSGRGDE